MLPFAKEVIELVGNRQAHLVELAGEAVERTPGLYRYSHADLSQVMGGFTKIMIEELEESGGETFDFYIETLIPCLVANGDTPTSIIRATVIFISCFAAEISLALRPEIRAEVNAWLASYCGKFVAAVMDSSLGAAGMLPSQS